MPLLKCVDCDAPVSSHAQACLQCGCPIEVTLGTQPSPVQPSGVKERPFKVCSECRRKNHPESKECIKCGNDKFLRPKGRPVTDQLSQVGPEKVVEADRSMRAETLQAEVNDSLGKIAPTSQDKVARIIGLVFIVMISYVFISQFRDINAWREANGISSDNTKEFSDATVRFKYPSGWQVSEEQGTPGVKMYRLCPYAGSVQLGKNNAIVVSVKAGARQSDYEKAERVIVDLLSKFPHQKTVAVISGIHGFRIDGEAIDNGQYLKAGMVCGYQNSLLLNAMYTFEKDGQSRAITMDDVNLVFGSISTGSR